MENLTHSLLGAALAELVLPASAARSQRRIFFAAGVIAANLPDADLLYTSITPPPLGYLLHHRGHTHTLVGLAAQALLVGAVCLLPAIRHAVGGARNRLWVLVAFGLLSHLVLDSWNSYGVHPFYPFDARWYYGDALFIVEPWFWLFLGVAAVMNAHHGRARIILGALFALASAAFVWIGMVPLVSLGVVVVCGAMLVWLVRKWTPRMRSGAALAAVAVFVLMMFGLRQEVRARVIASIAPALHGELVDVILSPVAATPLCWSVVTIERDDHAAEYVMTQGSASLVPRILSTSACGLRGSAAVEWRAAIHQRIARLRELDRDDCHVHAWLQFGRAPVLSDSAIADFRFGGDTRDNFSDMPLAPRASEAALCPPHLTHWGQPRGDLLLPNVDEPKTDSPTRGDVAAHRRRTDPP